MAGTRSRKPDLSNRTGKVAAWQRRHIEQVRLNQEWIGDALGRAVAGARFPLHFIDFEAARIAVPHHKGMRPYGQVAFQWSCHTLAAPGEQLMHREHLNLDPVWPNEQFARTLRDAIGDEGTVLGLVALRAERARVHRRGAHGARQR